MVVCSVPNNCTDVCSFPEVAAISTVSPTRGVGGATVSFSSPRQTDGFSVIGDALVIPVSTGAGVTSGGGGASADGKPSTVGSPGVGWAENAPLRSVPGAASALATDAGCAGS